MTFRLLSRTTLAVVIWSLAFAVSAQGRRAHGSATFVVVPMLEPNVCGSSSYGDARLRGNLQDIRRGDDFDLTTRVDTLIAVGVADPNQLAVRGWS